MYHPYLRGKQYELITVREMASLMKEAGFCPVIEPVRETLSGLQKALDAIVEVDGRAIVVVNPLHGELSGAGEPLTQLLRGQFLNLHGISAGVLLTQKTTVDQALASYGAHSGHAPAFVHAGFTEAKLLADRLAPPTKDTCHIFIDRFCGKLYQKQFKGARRVLVKDGFEKKRNRDYDPIERFSDLHATFTDEGMDGFGDFLTVGDDFSETGGPAYAVAIHLTFINPDLYNEMQIYHFLSQRQDTPKDPAGKFAEALDRMITTLNRPDSHVLETKAVTEFRDLHKQRHFPGLGYIKKLSMNHHIETLADYFSHAV